MNSRIPSDELLSAFLDGEVTPAERAQVEQFLRESAVQDANSSQVTAALRKFDELRRLQSFMRELPRYSLGSDFAAQVLRSAERAMAGANVAETNVASDPSPRAAIPFHGSESRSRANDPTRSRSAIRNRYRLAAALAVLAPALALMILSARNPGPLEPDRGVAQLSENDQASPNESKSREGESRESQALHGVSSSDSRPPKSVEEYRLGHHDDSGERQASSLREAFDSDQDPQGKHRGSRRSGSSDDYRGDRKLGVEAEGWGDALYKEQRNADQRIKNLRGAGKGIEEDQKISDQKAVEESDGAPSKSPSEHSAKAPMNAKGSFNGGAGASRQFSDDAASDGKSLPKFAQTKSSASAAPAPLSRANSTRNGPPQAKSPSISPADLADSMKAGDSLGLSNRGQGIGASRFKSNDSERPAMAAEGMTRSKLGIAPPPVAQTAAAPSAAAQNATAPGAAAPGAGSGGFGGSDPSRGGAVVGGAPAALGDGHRIPPGIVDRALNDGPAEDQAADGVLVVRLSLTRQTWEKTASADPALGRLLARSRTEEESLRMLGARFAAPDVARKLAESLKKSESGTTEFERTLPAGDDSRDHAAKSKKSPKESPAGEASSVPAKSVPSTGPLSRGVGGSRSPMPTDSKKDGVKPADTEDLNRADLKSADNRFAVTASAASSTILYADENTSIVQIEAEPAELDALLRRLRDQAKQQASAFGLEVVPPRGTPEMDRLSAANDEAKASKHSTSNGSGTNGLKLNDSVRVDSLRTGPSREEKVPEDRRPTIRERETVEPRSSPAQEFFRAQPPAQNRDKLGDIQKQESAAKDAGATKQAGVGKPGGPEGRSDGVGKYESRPGSPDLEMKSGRGSDRSSGDKSTLGGLPVQGSAGEGAKVSGLGGFGAASAPATAQSTVPRRRALFILQFSDVTKPAAPPAKPAAAPK